MGLVNDDNSEVRLNALKAITCLSEAPEGRRNLLHHVDQVRHDHLHSDLFSRGYATLHLAMSVGKLVRRSVTFLNSKRFLHYCSCPTVRDWIAGCRVSSLVILKVCSGLAQHDSSRRLSELFTSRFSNHSNLPRRKIFLIRFPT